ncbi:hypothetical protein ACOMHN_003396 [Nucella lapillus]
MVSTPQWLIRWGCLALIALGTLMQMVGMASPFWIRDQARPPAYAAFLRLYTLAGGHPALFNLTAGTTASSSSSSSSQGVVVREAGADVGLWKWCVELKVETGVGGGGRTSYHWACHSPDLSEFPGWWRASQVTAVVGTLMGILACVCAGLELHYLRRGVHFSGLLVLCSISCFVAALGISVSHGMFGTKYTETLMTILHLPSYPGWPGPFSLYPPVLGWAFGLGAAGAALIGSTGIALLAVITRTYPTYQRTENVVV